MKALLSSCESYRYVLQRGSGAVCAIVLANPSTADATGDDPTTLKLRRFTRDWGYSAFDLFNVAALRATDPAELTRHPDPVGPDNDFYLSLCAEYPLIVVGWGNLGAPEHVRRAVSILTRNGAQLYCLGVNANGSPKHPLYVPYSAKLVPWRYT